MRGGSIGPDAALRARQGLFVALEEQQPGRVGEGVGAGSVDAGQGGLQAAVQAVTSSPAPSSPASTRSSLKSRLDRPRFS